jgi:hypothetical protein
MPPSSGPPLALTEYQRSFVVDLHAAAAEFLVVGAVGMSAHGYSRPTHDLDIWLNPTEHNAKRVLPVIRKRFRNTPAALTETWLVSPKKRLPLPSDVGKEIDLIARSSRLPQPFGISVKARSRSPGTEHTPLNLYKKDFPKLEAACEAFGCIP